MRKGLRGMTERSPGHWPFRERKERRKNRRRKKRKRRRRKRKPR